jgi:metal-responsive CopG/Arc/MetJ family transcriptional regulator
MENLPAKVPADLLDEIEAHADEHHDGNRSEAVRELLRQGLQYDELRDERDRLERQYRQLIDRQDEHAELVEYVERERSLEERRRRAGLGKRAKWWLLGMPDDEIDD